jgi:hypothetical protein
MPATQESQKKTSNIHSLIRNERVKTFRMVRDCRNGKITLTQQQLLASEVLLRCAMEYSPHNPFRSIDNR